MTNGILQIDKNFLGSSFTEIKDYDLAVLTEGLNNKKASTTTYVASCA